MKLIVRILRIVFIIILLFLVVSIFKHTHEYAYDDKEIFVYSEGSAPDSIRQEILQVLKQFQEGYTNRDISVLPTYMEQLFSKKNLLILGTMPREVCEGLEEAEELVRSDWESWGDCTFFIDNANISCNEGTAWFSTLGHVEFDLTSLLDLPLRLTGTMVNENNTWKIQQLQFQFDLDLSFQLLVIFILGVWLVISIVTLVVLAIRKPRKV
jgi:hypothetical protein